ncbi:MAG: HD domain-containing protein [Ignisphaera sp.]|nr:HD domain-containing protein [Ignisphaera sp.]MCX8167405.1 HD domain-containing protein [Ignisphaera sp.]MDW8085939.1 HD domain-containing protein [Ignisphaera sp.]
MSIDMDRYKIVKDPVHGYIKIYQHELPIIDSYVFQRLRRIKQLSVADVVYPGAVHTRFHHSLGTAHIAETMVRELLRKLRLRQSDVDRYVALVRLLALLHDVGHGPFSHLFEEYVLLPKGLTHEDVGASIVVNIDDVSSKLDSILSSYGYGPTHIAKALKSREVGGWPFTSNITYEANEKAFYYIIKGAFSADIIDYLLRDSYYTGAKYGDNIDWYRLSYYLYISGDNLVLDYRALDVFEQMIIARLHMFSTVYYHKTVRAAYKSLGDILRKIDELRLLDFNRYLNSIESYIELDDNFILLNDKVRNLSEVREFLSRRIPYKAIAEHRISIPDNVKSIEHLLEVDKRAIENSLEEAMRSRGLEMTRDRDFFVDTPKLSLNPMLNMEDVYVALEGGYIQRRRVFELPWVNIPKTAAVVRVYIRRSLLDRSVILREAFNRIVEGEDSRSGLRSLH